MERCEYFDNEVEKIKDCSVRELAAIARKDGIKLYSKMKPLMVNKIAEVKTNREFRGIAFWNAGAANGRT